MNETLTTGQMIDRLKPNEVAKAVKGTYEGYQVKKTDLNEIVPVDSAQENFLTLNTFAMKTEWIIIPNYVSFEEAIKAYQEGKEIWSYIDNDFDLRFADYSNGNKNSGEQEISIEEILNGKWVIRD